MSGSLMGHYIKKNKKVLPDRPADFSVADEILGNSASSFLKETEKRNRFTERELSQRYVYLIFVDDKRLDADGLECDVFVYGNKITALKEYDKIVQDYISYLKSVPEKYRDKMEIVYEPNKQCIITENNGEFLIASVRIEQKELL